MKVKIVTLCLFICLLSAAKAASVVGAQIGYRHITADKYEITATCYRDCNGAVVSNVPVDINCSSGTGTVVLSLSTVRDVTGLPASCLSKSACAGGTFGYGVEEYTYTGTVDLSSYSCCQVRLSWSLSARVSSTNLANISYNYAHVIINKCQPTSFSWGSLPPSPVIRTGNDVVMSFAALDTFDFDSITYELADILDGYGSPSTYSGNFTGTKPLSFLGFPNQTLTLPAGFHIDALGNVAFRPTTTGQTAFIGVKATEWRKIGGTPTVVGESFRNFAVTVLTSPNNVVPKLPAQAPFKACIGENNCFDITVTDANANDTIDINYDGAISGAVFSRTGGITSRTVTICWTPDTNLVNTGPRIFTLEARDRACTEFGRILTTFSIVAGTKFTDTTKIIKTKACNVLSVKAQKGSTGSGQFVYKWELTGANLNVTKTADSVSNIAIQDTGWKKIKLSITNTNYCNTQVYYDSVYYAPADVVKPYAGKDTAMCGNNKITLSGSAQFGTAPYTYIWIGFGAGQTLNATLSSNYNAIRLNVTDSKGCTGSDTVQVNFSKMVVTPNYTDTITCSKLNSTFSTTGAASPITITKNTDSTFNNYTIGSHTFTRYRKDIEITDGIGCKTSYTARDNVSVRSAVVPKSGIVCEGDQTEFKIDSVQVNLPVKYLWQTGDTTETLKFTVPQTGSVYFLTRTIQVTDAYGCKMVLSVSAQSFPPPNMLLFPTADKCEKDAPVTLSPLTATGGTWTGPGVSNDTVFDPSTAGAGIHYLVCHYTDTLTGCSNMDSVSVKVVKPLVAGFSADKTIVKPNTPITFTADNGITGNWDFGDPTNPSNNQIGKTATISYPDTGYYTVIMKTTMNGPCPAGVETKTAYIHVTFTTGIHNAEKASVSVYPNPAAGLLHIVSDRSIMQVILSDMQGKTVYTEIMGGKTNAVINVSGLSAGIYLLKTIDEMNAISVIKISVQP